MAPRAMTCLTGGRNRQPLIVISWANLRMIFDVCFQLSYLFPFEVEDLLVGRSELLEYLNVKVRETTIYGSSATWYCIGCGRFSSFSFVERSYLLVRTPWCFTKEWQPPYKTGMPYVLQGICLLCSSIPYASSEDYSVISKNSKTV